MVLIDKKKKKKYESKVPHARRALWSGGGGTAAYAAVAANFDATNDYLTHPGGILTGIVPGKILLMAGWFRIAGGAGLPRRIFSIISGTASRFALLLNPNSLYIQGRTSTNTDVLVATTNTPPSVDVWHHFAISVDLTSTLTRSFYLDKVAVPVTWTTYDTGGSSIDFAPSTTPTTLVGRATAAAPTLWNGDLADLYFDTPASYYDLSIPANLAKLIGSGPAIDLGANGSLVTGVQPLVYLSGTITSWHTNKGSGGGFTPVGALTDGLTPVQL